MATYLIHYELFEKPDIEYPGLIPILTGLGAKRITGSAWAVTTDLGTAELRDKLQLCVLPGDRFIFARIDEWRTIGTMNRIESTLGSS